MSRKSRKVILGFAKVPWRDKLSPASPVPAKLTDARNLFKIINHLINYCF